VTQLLIIFFSTLPSPSDIYTLSLHDALPICEVSVRMQRTDGRLGTLIGAAVTQDRLATRDVDYLNSTNSKAWVEVTDRNQFPGGTIPWSVGQVTPVYFKIPILDDLLEEGDELVDLSFLRADGSLNLSGEIIPLGGALGRPKYVLDIIDNDFPKGEFNFLLSNFVTNEFTSNTVVATITVIRTNGAYGDVSVDYFTRNSPITPTAT